MVWSQPQAICRPGRAGASRGALNAEKEEACAEAGGVPVEYGKCRLSVKGSALRSFLPLKAAMLRAAGSRQPAARIQASFIVDKGLPSMPAILHFWRTPSWHQVSNCIPAKFRQKKAPPCINRASSDLTCFTLTVLSSSTFFGSHTHRSVSPDSDSSSALAAKEWPSRPKPGQPQVYTSPLSTAQQQAVRCL